LTRRSGWGAARRRPIHPSGVVHRAATVLEAASRGLDRLTFVAAVPLGVFFVGIVFANVLARYVFSSPILGSVEYARIAFVWATFIGASMALRRRSHIRLQFLADALPARVRGALDVVLWMLVIAFLAFVAYQGWRLTGRVERTFFPASGVSQVYLYLPLPVSAAIMIVHATAHLLRDLAALVGGHRPATTSDPRRPDARRPS
jgi:TRAP-type transport system small permease protein